MAYITWKFVAPLHVLFATMFWCTLLGGKRLPLVVSCVLVNIIYVSHLFDFIIASHLRSKLVVSPFQTSMGLSAEGHTC